MTKLSYIFMENEQNRPKISGKDYFSTNLQKIWANFQNTQSIKSHSLDFEGL